MLKLGRLLVIYLPLFMVLFVNISTPIIAQSTEIDNDTKLRVASLLIFMIATAVGLFYPISNDSKTKYGLLRYLPIIFFFLVIPLNYYFIADYLDFYEVNNQIIVFLYLLTVYILSVLCSLHSKKALNKRGK
jgi:hypothetical protein